MHLKKYGWISILLCGCLMAGCSNMGIQGNVKNENQKEINESTITALEKTPDLNYEVPVSIPGILVDQEGYEINGKKVAIFQGEEIPDQFEIVDELTGDIVFSQTLEIKEGSEEDNEKIAYGDFTEWDKAGQYYIQADILGRSYSFNIEEDLYNNVFKLACKQYYVNRCGITLVEELAKDSAHIACHTMPAVYTQDVNVQMDVSGGWHMDENYSKNVIKGSQVMNNLLLSYELYGEAFTDDIEIPESKNGIPDILDEIKYEADWMLKMQDSKTGGIYSEVIVKEKTGPVGTAATESYVKPITLEATAAFSATMAKFSYIYQEYDAVYATECLRAADRAWKFMEKNRNKEEVTQRFFAAAELYRATGYGQYRREAEAYLNNEIYKNLDEDSIFWGCVTYISTQQAVNVDLCGMIMKNIMSEAEKISLEARGSRYMVVGADGKDENEKILSQMTRLAVVDHIITNHEYETVIENHLHYFLGRNPKAASYIDGAGKNSYVNIDASQGITNHIDWNAEFIFMMSEVIGWYHRQGQ